MSIKINNLTYIYNPDTVFEKKALDNISLEIKKGSFIGLIGHTGSGKSTLIQHLNGLIKPSFGEVLLNDYDINKDKESLKLARQKVGVVFQYPEHQLFEITVFKDIAYGPTNLGLSKEEVRERVLKSIKIVGLDEDICEKSPFDLSGGQKRRVAIAGILAMEPEVLVLDEPTAGLDPKGRDDILEAISDMHKTLGITVVLVSHSMEDIARFVDEIVVMYKSKIYMKGTPPEIFSRVNELEKIGLAAPQISYVFKALRERGFDVPLDVYTTRYATNELLKFFKQVEK